MKSLSIFGLGKLGATMVGCFASAGFRAVGVDVNAGQVAKVNSGAAPVPEPDLQALYDRNAARISATTDAAEAVRESDASFIIVPTPSLPDGEFNTTIAAAVARSIGQALRRKRKYHLVVLTSTVLPGATERDIRTALEQSSGKVCGRDFGLCYSPEFIAIGDVIQGLLHPDFFLIGEFDARSGRALEAIYRKIGGAKAVIVRMSIPSAEVTKIAVNTYVTMKISFANTLSRLCARLPGGDAHAVAAAIGLDKRVGGRYLLPGPTFGGPCFPRDTRAFEWFARSLGEAAPLARAAAEINDNQVDFLVKAVLDAAPKARTIGILGLSYKPRTNLTDEALGAHLARKFLFRGYRVLAFDPWVARYGVTEPVDGVELVPAADRCIAEADVVVLATPHDEFRKLRAADFRRRRKPLVDMWAFLREQVTDRDGWYTVPGVCKR